MPKADRRLSRTKLVAIGRANGGFVAADNFSDFDLIMPCCVQSGNLVSFSCKLRVVIYRAPLTSVGERSRGTSENFPSNQETRVAITA